MKARSACAAVFSVGTALLLLARIPSSQSAEIQIVSPSAYEYIDAPDGGAGGTTPFRFQQVFPAADFAALGNKPHWLVGYTFRPDQSLTSPRTVHFPDNEIRFSTTQMGPGDLSELFDDNLGPDVVQFYRGLVILEADIDDTSPIPREFYHAECPAGVTPFLYDPSQGNLLFDAIGWEGISPSTFNDRVPDIQTTRYASDPSATHGAWIPAVMVQFTFITVPEPTQLIINGGFETPDTSTYITVSASQNDIAPWVVGLHSVQVGDAAGNGVIVGPVFEGEQFLDLVGLGRGRITQDFPTTPGSLYTLTFAYTDNYFEPSATPPSSARVRVFDGLGDRLNQTITHTGAVAGDYDWTLFTGQFTALQDTTSLEFTALNTSASGYSGGIMLDGVQVNLALRATLVVQGSGAILNWTGGTPPYRVQCATSLTLGDWRDVLTNAVPPVTLTQERQAEFYRIVGQ